MIALLLGVSVGCARDGADSIKTSKSSEGAEKKPAASLTLEVLVVNEPKMAEAVKRLRGEWEERSGGKLTVKSTSWAEVASAEKLEADAIVFPSRYVGELSTRGWLRPVRSNVLQSKEFDEADLFPVVSSRLMKWGAEVVALPLGADISSPSNSKGVSLLARVAPTIVSDAEEGLLFDTQTMKPRITDAPFVEAVKAAKLEHGEKANNANATSEKSTQAPSSRSAPVLGYGDRLISVTAETHNAASAFKLIGWLASPETSTQIAKGSEPITPVRRSLVNSPAWYDASLEPDEREALTKRAAQELSTTECLMVPRIPGVDEYMAALDAVVDEAIIGNVQPKTALQKAADRWEAITDAQGREAQREAYLKNLGFGEP
jgi:ABC-type glycerol-3-phosphate transport system substrate-binding protein